MVSSNELLRRVSPRAKVEVEALRKLLNASTVCVSLQYGYMC